MKHKTARQIKEQLKRIRQQRLIGNTQSDYWRGVRDALQWALDPEAEATWLA